MKTSVRLLLLTVVAFAALALSACGGVQAGSASRSDLNNPGSTEVVSTASVNSNDAHGTETPDVAGTQSGFETPGVAETPHASETPSASETHSPNELVGVVTAKDATTITINGVVYQLANLPSLAASLKVGDKVKVEFVVNADGSVTVREIKVSAGASSGLDGNSNSNDVNSNDHMGNGNSNGHDSNSNDHTGNGNSNGHDSNSNDHTGNGNSNDTEHPPVVATP